MCIGEVALGGDFIDHYALSMLNNYMGLISQYEIVCLESISQLNNCELCLILVSQL